MIDYDAFITNQDRLFGMAVPALGWNVLSEGRAASAVAQILRATLRYSRGQQHLLSAAARGNACLVASERPVTISLRRQGKPLPHAHEEANRSGRPPRSPVYSRGRASRTPRPGSLPAASSAAQRYGAAGTVSRT